MSAAREDLQRALCQYIKDTFSHIGTVRGFCERLSTWTDARKTELTKMTKMTKDTDQQKLAAVLKGTLGGLEELDSFLDALEKLAVTSLHVFTLENQGLRLPEGICPEDVQLVIIVTRIICPHLLEFKRDASAFFLPKLQNVEVLSYQLNEYIKTTQEICEKLQKSSFSDFCMKMNDDTVVDLHVDVSEDDIQMMLSHINQLKEIRMNQHFRMVFLFQEVSCSDFICEFSKRQPGMLQSLEDLEQCAVQLDRMNKGAKISSVAGSSVGTTGGVLSIIGLALIPVTAGLSLGLIIGGTALGITSGVNAVVTTTTEIVVNSTFQGKASKSFQSFMEDVQSIQKCLEVVSAQPAANIQWEIDYVEILSQLKTIRSVGRKINSLITDVRVFFQRGQALPNITRVPLEIADIGQTAVQGSHAAKVLKSEELAVSAGKVALQEGKALRNVPRVGADLPDIGQVAVKGSLGLSKSARAGLIGLNALFIGLDVFFICKDSISLYKGSETEVSQLIRARSVLWRSEMDSWKKIYDFLNKGLPTSKRNKAVLETPFYPERETKKE